MQYIVLDLEWNQAMSAQSSVFLKLPFHLRGEIIQIGAVKLDERGLPGDEYKCDIRPVYFRRMHYKVKKLTGFDKERLLQGKDFAEAIEEFLDWCGPDAVFLTWGYDDHGIMEQNLMLHDLDIDWCDNWVNLQLIFNVQTGGDKNQKALSTAMEHFEIEQTRTAHDALGDAYNTALIASRLDLARGIEEYEKAMTVLTARGNGEPRPTSGIGKAPIEHSVSHEYMSMGAAFADPGLTTVHCPECGKAMKNTRWVNQGDRRYMSVTECRGHQSCLLRLKFRQVDDHTCSVARIVYRADEEMLRFYRDKAGRAKKHRVRRRSPKVK